MSEKTDLEYVVSALEELVEKINSDVKFLESHNFKIETSVKRQQMMLIDAIRRDISFIDRYEDNKIENLSFLKSI